MDEDREIRYVVVDAAGRSTFVYGPGQLRRADDGHALMQLLTDGWKQVCQTTFVDDDDEHSEEPCSLVLLAKAG